MAYKNQSPASRELSDSELDVISGGSKVGMESLHGAIVGHDSVVVIAKVVATQAGALYGSH